jgi:hypothetical protein
MIHEVVTKAGVVFQLDDETNEWMRWFVKGITSSMAPAHGEFTTMPRIEVGKSMSLAVKMYNAEVHLVNTQVITEYRKYNREHPVHINETLIESEG